MGKEASLEAPTSRACMVLKPPHSAAVRHDILASDKSSGIRREKNCEGCDVFGLAKISGIYDFRARANVWAVAQHLCIDCAWQDGIDANAQRLAFDRCRASEAHQARLRCCIGRDQG